MKTEYNMALILNPARRAALFEAARKIDPRVEGYVGTDEDGNHHMQISGVNIDIVVPAAAVL